MTEKTIATIIVGGIGIIYLIWPQLLINIQIWTTRVILGARFEPTIRTKKAYRVIGFILLAFGFLIWMEIIK